MLARLKGCGAARKSAFDQRLACVVEHLYINMEAFFALFQVGLGGLWAALFV